MKADSQKKEYIDLEVSLIFISKKKRAVGYISDTIHVTVLKKPITLVILH